MSLNGFVAFIALISFCTADVMVQLNVNRPLNDVSEKFISFSIKPEDLYQTLDGPNRKTWTRMAAMLGESYVKFDGDYNFAASSEMKLRNPTKIIWKGFNRWSRALNWTMIIPVPYAPKSWDPMETLKILNTSHMIGISECIWQLGDDFGSTRAQEYVNELETLNLMVDSFKPFVDSWKIIGADISAGSSADETRRYIEMSKGINAAYGWTQSSDLSVSNVDSLSSYLDEKDSSLKMLMSKKVPIWLNLPTKIVKNRRTKSKANALITTDNEVMEGLNWARILGDAASSGFDAVFKNLHLTDLERPDFSFYVTALFKRVMGSRVFPTRPMQLFARFNKLYTHCANDVSGGIAFMIVNTDDEPLQISVRSMTKFSGSEVWQYSLTSKKGVPMLNNERLTLNSTLLPQVKVRNLNRPIQLTTPGMSVNFWVFPTVNLDHCQYSEIETTEENQESVEEVIEKRYSSSDKLLRKLIQESSLIHGPKLGALLNRNRRSTNRARRFILEHDEEAEKSNKFGLEKIFDKTVSKRDHNEALNGDNTIRPFRWLMDKILDNPLSLRRSARSANDDDYFGNLFLSGKNQKRNSFTRKITEIRKPEQKLKPIFDLSNFDEEKFFKEMEQRSEPEYPRTPEGDVHLKHITNVDGDEFDDNEENASHAGKYVRKSKKLKHSSKEIVNEMKPLRLLPTEFYESQPENDYKPKTKKIGLGGAFNSLLFPTEKQKGGLFKNVHKRTSYRNSLEEQQLDSTKESQETNNENKKPISEQTEGDYFDTKKNLKKSYLGGDDDENVSNKAKEDDLEEQDEHQSLFDDKKDKILNQDNRKFVDPFLENFDNYFGVKTKKANKDEPKNIENPIRDNQTKKKIPGSFLSHNTHSLFPTPNQSYSESQAQSPWWDLSHYYKKRVPRALKSNNLDDSWQLNEISKYDDIIPLGAVVPEQLNGKFEYNIESNQIGNTNKISGSGYENIDKPDNKFARKIVRAYEPVRIELNVKQNAIVNETNVQLESGNEKEIENKIVNDNGNENGNETENENAKVSDKTSSNHLVSVVKKNVTKLVDIVRRHVSEWYHTLLTKRNNEKTVTIVPQ